jgi:TfoX/Sxy family transcriptional regulator of competence genes
MALYGIVYIKNTCSHNVKRGNLATGPFSVANSQATAKLLRGQLSLVTTLALLRSCHLKAERLRAKARCPPRAANTSGNSPMPYSESLAQRLRQVVACSRGWTPTNFTEKKMFGGIGFLLHGNMCVGVWKHSLIVRLHPDEYAQALKEEHVHEFDITGRPMRGWIMVEPDGIDMDDQLAAWVQKSIDYVSTLPKKAAGKKAR